MAENAIVNDVDRESVRESPSKKGNRYPISQEQIDDVLNNELKDFAFPVKPTYNPRIWANGMTTGEMYKWGQLKDGTLSIQIGKQDRPDRKFLVDTILHEYYESQIMINQYSNAFYRQLSKKSILLQHEWIDEQIAEYFKGLEGKS